MTRKRLVTVFASLFLGSFVLGAAGGSYYVPRGWGSLEAMRNLMADAHYSVYAHLQYINAPYPIAKDALLRFIDFVDELDREKDSLVSGKPAYFDTGFSYARLALLEEAQGDTIQMHEYFQKAGERLRLAGWTDVSETRIRNILIKLDTVTGFIPSSAGKTQ